MNSIIGARPPAWLRIVAIVALLWNLIGVYLYLATVGIVSAPAGTEMTPADPVPTWVTAAFAVSVFAGALGSLGLLMLKRWAGALLILSLAAILVQDVWVFLLSSGDGDMGGGVMAVLVTGIAILLVWLARSGGRRGWLT